MNEPKIHIVENKDELGLECAKAMVDIAKQSIVDKGMFTIALSGGSTPKLLYNALVKNFHKELDWSKVFFFWSDERYVPIDHEDSNAGMALTWLLNPLKIAPKNIYPVPTDISPPDKAAEIYQKTVLEHFKAEKYHIPEFDLVLLGLGDDGHTASLFPGTKALSEKNDIVKANWIDSKKVWRITFTYPLINHAKNVFMLTTGPDKAEMVSRILGKNEKSLPASLINPHHGELHWFLDNSAALKL